MYFLMDHTLTHILATFPLECFFHIHLSVLERRLEILKIMTVKRKSNVSKLAEKMGVSKRTIQRDIQALILFFMHTISSISKCMSLTWSKTHYSNFIEK